ncbi:hypothetical protein L208DRAFT_1252380 [Tricholoma matsutake]|nr:hypothetical protein L208DRAFT_1252380 [Tricholoma matsutake 945]
MDSVHQSMIKVIGLISNLLCKAIYGSDFWRGPTDHDGMSFFVGENPSTPIKFSVIGEVKGMGVNEFGPVLMLGKPERCGVTMDLFWQQQISALERVKL